MAKRRQMELDSQKKQEVNMHACTHTYTRACMHTYTHTSAGSGKWWRSRRLYACTHACISVCRYAPSLAHKTHNGLAVAQPARAHARTHEGKHARTHARTRTSSLTHSQAGAVGAACGLSVWFKLVSTKPSDWLRWRSMRSIWAWTRRQTRTCFGLRKWLSQVSTAFDCFCFCGRQRLSPVMPGLMS